MAIHTPTYACKCLNVRIFSQPSHKDVGQPSDDEYIPARVDDDGIVIQHSQLTLRMRSKAVPDSKDPLKTQRFMSLICLNCQLLVYRVSRSSTLNGEERPGPVLPTEEWVEKGVLKTSTGTVEVHKGCLTREAILQEESNPSYSSIFHMVLSSDSDTAEPMTPVPQLAPEAATPEPTTHLPTLPPLFLPPPFTPSHPAFSYLSSIANSESQAIRDAAEEYLARVTQEKLSEIKAHETRLRQQTETLWSQFRQGLEMFGGDKRNHLNHGRKEIPKWNGQGNSPSPGTLVTINDFVPTPVHNQRPNGGDLTPKASALSASLVNSGFHHPRERRSPNSSGSPKPPVTSNVSETSTSPVTASSLTLTNFIEVDESNDILEPFKRDMSDSRDLATSLLVLNLEAEMERRRRAARTETAPESSAQGAQRPDTTVAETTKPNKDTTKAINGIDSDLTQNPQLNTDQSASENEHTSPKAKKGKRKVTFDVQPDVVTIKRDVTKEQEADRLDASTNGQVEVSIFDLEEGGDRASSKEDTVSLPLLDLTQAPRQKSHQRSRSSGGSGTGLPQSLSSLRPISLPSPLTSRLVTPSESAVTSPKEESTPDSVISSPELPNQHYAADEDDAMLKLVAAHTPSHRGFWDKDNGKALRRIMGESDAKWGAPKNLADSDAASINDDIGWTSYEPPEDIARSLPVFIAPPLASKQHVKSERPSAPPELPLPLEPKEVVEEAAEEDVGPPEGEGRGRERALRIIQARDKLPEPGMWRSLA